MGIGHNVSASKYGSVEFFLAVSLVFGTILLPCFVLGNAEELRSLNNRLGWVNYEIQTRQRIAQAVEMVQDEQ
jgi:hypothetical protein